MWSIIIFDLTIIGAGVIGLSIGKYFSQLGNSVLIIEKESRAGEGTSSRNSGVIHAGIYYPENSFKSRFCVEGNKMLYEYADEKNISHSKVGKYIVASQAGELNALEKLFQQGIRNNVNLKYCSKEEIEEAKSVNIEDLKHPEKDEDRAKDPEWLVMLGVCTHLGCVPLDQKGDYNGWFCPCHGSHYDTSGRIRKGPAPTNLEIPDYVFLDDNTIKIG